MIQGMIDNDSWHFRLGFKTRDLIGYYLHGRHQIIPVPNEIVRFKSQTEVPTINIDHPLNHKTTPLHLMELGNEWYVFTKLIIWYTKKYVLRKIHACSLPKILFASFERLKWQYLSHIFPHLQEINFSMSHALYIYATWKSLPINHVPQVCNCFVLIAVHDEKQDRISLNFVKRQNESKIRQAN